jgi:hypothetical protein
MAWVAAEVCVRKLFGLDEKLAVNMIRSGNQEFMSTPEKIK